MTPNGRRNSLNEELKRQEAVNGRDDNATPEDDSPALSPGRLLRRRFFRSGLAVTGIVILLLMFLFSFIGPLFYGYSQTQVFYKSESLSVAYASAAERTEAAAYAVGDTQVGSYIRNRLDSYISGMESNGETMTMVTDENGAHRVLEKAGDKVYILYAGANTENRVGGAVALVASSYVFDAADTGTVFSDDFRADALLALCGDGVFTAEGETYTVTRDADGIRILDGSGMETASLGTVAVRRATGEDTLPPAFKEKARQVIEAMRETGETTARFTFSLPEEASSGGENAADTAFTVVLKNGEYTFSRDQLTQLIDIYAPPSRAHLFGTDGDGMDILARMMAGGRVSLTVGFVVVLLETLLGAVLGGLAGFFGGWADTLVMRLADVFFCVPALPILVILGAFFDAIKMAPYLRLFWMMAILGLLGWTSVARLVRGQILSLREQDFMIAEEAAGIRTSRRIFRHLIPNVMPLLIVNATMSLGSVILLESTLSFLGLGVKHPLATWGTMINSVARSTDSMIKYAYIWVPVGMLICLTVVAFNFVGDGLRDAMDPKTKR